MKRINFSGCLFDLDGTLVDSILSVNRAWTSLAERHGLDRELVLKSIHGRPASECIKEFLCHKPKLIIQHEIEWLKERETNDTEGIVAIEGAIEFIQLLKEKGIPWGIVTSGIRSVAKARMLAGGIPQPNMLVTAEDIKNGKPNPEPYYLGAERLKLDVRDCIVFEDALAGVWSGLSAGAQVIAITNHGKFKQLAVSAIISRYNDLDIAETDTNWQLILR